MPKIVNHEERRQVLVEAAWRVIARLGIEHTTTREIARESGYSAGALAHYFPTRDSILRAALERADADVERRIRAIPGDLAPLAALKQVLLQGLPLDATREMELTLYANFLTRALNQPALRSLKRHDHDRWRAAVLRYVSRARDAGELSDAMPAADIADVLVAFIDGLGIQGLVYPELITPGRMEALLEQQVVAYAAEKTATA